MNTHRYRNAGRITQYELASLPPHLPRRCRWIYVWDSLAVPFHPASFEEWERRAS